MAESEIQRAVQEALAAEDPRGVLLALGPETEIHAAGDAAAVAMFARERRAALLDLRDREPLPLVSVVADLFQEVRTREAFETLAAEGLPVLRETYDALMQRSLSGEEGENVLFLVKVFALYRQEEDVPRIGRAARHPVMREGLLWSSIFHAIDEGHPLRRAALDEMRGTLPEGFAGVAYLDFANRLAREDGASHPFDTVEGTGRLEAYLLDSEPGRYSHAHSAAAALPFISEPARGRLLALAFDHPSERVQLEAGWASAKIGSRAGIDFLARLCLDVRYSALAVEYLRELGELNAIPARAMNPEFAAAAEMCRWLSHPMEFGRPPAEARCVDARTLNWPPSNDTRRLYVVTYRYPEGEPATGRDGVGLVGSITFSLIGETSPATPPGEVYSLHCCWELEAENDPRAPKERSVEAGRELLRRARNVGF